MADDIRAMMKLLSIEHGFAWEESDYEQAIDFGVLAYGMGRRLAAADVAAEAQRYPSIVMAPVESAFKVAEQVALSGTLQHRATPHSGDSIVD